MVDAENPIDAWSALKKEKSWRRAVHRDQVRYNKKIFEIKHAISEGNLAKLSALQSWFLTSSSAKRVAIAQLFRSGKKINVWSYNEVEKLANTVTVFEPMDERVRLFAKEKTSKTGFRTIFSFGDRHRVAQRMLANVIQGHTTKRAYQYFDAGVPKAIKRALSIIELGSVWIAHLDIRDFYPSFTIEGLTDFLPMPQAVVEAALTGRNMKLTSESLTRSYPHSHQQFIEEARRGLPQGASSSPAISHLCVSQLVLDVAPLEHLFNYEDDFLLLAKSRAQLNSRIEKLKTAVGKLPGGQFELSVKSSAHAEEVT